MATAKEQAHAEVRRLERELASAEEVLRIHEKTEREDKARGFDKVGPAKTAVANAKRALDISRAELSRFR